jgi:hypothetical protein
MVSCHRRLHPGVRLEPKYAAAWNTLGHSYRNGPAVQHGP